jgi:DegV family protein with EDD domain
MAARDIAIITDSTCDIPSDLIEKHNITIVPHTIIWDNQQLLDRVEIQPEEFYQKIREGASIPTTSQATEQDFFRSFEQVISRGAKEILVITLSSRLSGALQSARNAAKLVSYPVHVIDSLGVTMSLGWQVLAAARVRELGGTVDAMINKVNEVRKTLVLNVCMDTVEFVKRGGRIGEATRLIGMMLNIKPVVRINHIKGMVEEAGIARTYKKAIDIMYQKFFESLDVTKKLHIAVMHGGAMEEAEILIQRICNDYNPVEILTNVTTPVLGINTGPGALALAGYTED